jgi:two-component system sensor histidine kinase VicK
VIVQAGILTTFIIVLLSTVTFLLARNIVEDILPKAIPGLAPGAVQNVEINRDAVLRNLHLLAVSQGIIGSLCILLAVALSYLLAKQLTQPLRSLTSAVSNLKPGSWMIERSVHSGDEVEVLDRVVSDMALRLQQVYEYQEGEIQARTAELKKQYLLDRAILQNMQQGVITVDKEGLITAANPAALGMLIKKSDELLRKDILQVIDLRGHRGNPLVGEHPVTLCLSAGTPVTSLHEAHVNIQRPDGSLLPIFFAATPLLEDGKVFGAVFVFQDMSEERRLDYLKSEFISLASHQLRTPLSSVRWYVELFGEEKDKLSEEQRGYLSEMDRGLTRMVALLTALLNAAHLEGEGTKPELQTVDCVKLLRDIAADSKLLFEESTIHCTVSAPETPVELITDPTLFGIILQNLIGNAVKYSPKGSALEIGLIEKGTDAVITVTDHGMGIPKEEQGRIFEKFFRAKNVRKVDTDGNGLGLYISKTIADRLGATMTFWSDEGKGTTFTVVLPKKK